MYAWGFSLFILDRVFSCHDPPGLSLPGVAVAIGAYHYPCLFQIGPSYAMLSDYELEIPLPRTPE